LCCEVVLMACQRGCESFAFIKTRKMEGLCPSVLVQFGGAVVVAYVDCERELMIKECGKIPFTTSV
jgi:hypothetical protein